MPQESAIDLRYRLNQALRDLAEARSTTLRCQIWKSTSVRRGRFQCSNPTRLSSRIYQALRARIGPSWREYSIRAPRAHKTDGSH